MFHKQKPLCNNLFMWKPGCSLARLRLCVCVCVCVFWREGGDTSQAVCAGFFFFFPSSDFVFNKGQRSGLLWGRRKGHLGWTGQELSGGQVRGPTCWGRSLEPLHLALLLAGRVVSVGSRLSGLLPSVWLQWGPRPRAGTSLLWPGQLSFHPAPALATLAKR